MPETSREPHSPTLVPPRKSVELEDPGAHELGKADAILGTQLLLPGSLTIPDSSEAEEDVFADAQEDRYPHSGPSSPIPTTRVEKVGNSFSQSWENCETEAL